MGCATALLGDGSKARSRQEAKVGAEAVRLQWHNLCVLAPWLLLCIAGDAAAAVVIGLYGMVTLVSTLETCLNKAI